MQVNVRAHKATVMLKSRTLTGLLVRVCCAAELRHTATAAAQRRLALDEIVQCAAAHGQRRQVRRYRPPRIEQTAVEFVEILYLF